MDMTPKKKAAFVRWWEPDTHEEVRKILTQDDAVYCAVPPQRHRKFYHEIAQSKIGLVAVEKPWFGADGYQDALDILNFLPKALISTIRCIDHFLHKPPTRFVLDNFGRLLQGPVRRIWGRVFESEDSNPHISEAMNIGATHDLLIHPVSVLTKILNCHASQFDVAKSLLMRHADFPSPFESYVRAIGRIQLGDGYTSFDLEAGKLQTKTQKYLTFEGESQRLVIDFGGAVYLTDNEPEEERFPFPGADLESEYRHILRRVLAFDRTVGLSVDEAVEVLKFLHNVRGLAGPVQDYDG